MTDAIRRKRQSNERRFPNWTNLEDGGRMYSYERIGKSQYTVRYVKIVDKNERTLSFYQEILDEQKKLVEIHQKYPQDRGHKKVG